MADILTAAEAGIETLQDKSAIGALIEAGASVRPEYVELYIPGRFSDDTLIPHNVRQRALERAQRFLSESFGGCTSTQGVGCWQDSAKRLHHENVIVLRSSAPAGAINRHGADIVAMAQWILTWLRQSAVAVSINGTLLILEGE